MFHYHPKFQHPVLMVLYSLALQNNSQNLSILFFQKLLGSTGRQEFQNGTVLIGLILFLERCV